MGRLQDWASHPPVVHNSARGDLAAVKLPNPTPPELPESRLLTFIDSAREFALYFLEGQRLIHDLALLHGIHGLGFGYWRDAVLSIQPMIGLLEATLPASIPDASRRSERSGSP